MVNNRQCFFLCKQEYNAARNLYSFCNQLIHHCIQFFTKAEHDTVNYIQPDFLYALLTALEMTNVSLAIELGRIKALPFYLCPGHQVNNA